MAVGFREFVTTTLAARAAYHCEEASGNLLDDGSQNNPLTVNGTPVYEIADTITYEDGKAIDFDGTTDFFDVVSGFPPDNGGTGTQLCFFRIPVGQTGGIVYGMGNSGGATALFVRIRDDQITLSIQATAGNRYLAQLNGLTLDDGLWHLLVLVQPGGNVGIDLYFDALLTGWSTEVISGTGTLDFWFADVVSASTQFSVGASPDNGHTQPYEGDISCYAITRTIMNQAQIDELLLLTTTDPTVAAGDFGTLLEETGNGALAEGPGPDWWWRMNDTAGPILDSGIAQNRGVSPINADSIITGGDPLFGVTGALPSDATNAAIYFDGAGDYFEIGVNGVAGQLVDVDTGSIGGFFSRNGVVDENIIYAQSNDAGTAFWRLALNETNFELIVQTSVGNRVTLTSQPTFRDNDFRFFVLTCDGSIYRLYLDGKEDFLFTVVTDGTGAEGDWFDAVTADNSSIASEADSGFTTETIGRVSELFIYDGAVLSAVEIQALFDAAEIDGLGSSATDVGALVFEDVTFLNGARADIRLSNSLTTFNQVLQVNRSRFIGGLEGEDVESISLTGEARAMVRGCTFDLDVDPTTGRAAVLATTADPTVGATTYGNLLVSDCTFNRMGHGDVEVHPAIFAESGFGMTIEKNRFLDSYVGAVGWRGDARRIIVAHNLIDGVTNGAAAISCQVGLNTNVGNAWRVGRNTILDVLVGNGISLTGGNSDATAFARDIQIIGNNVQTVVQKGIILTQLADMLAYGNRIGGSVTEGIRLGEIAGVVQILRNFIEDNTDEGIILAEASNQVATLVVDRNTINSAAGDGMLFNGINELVITNNKFLNLVNGLSLGDIASSVKFFGNQFNSISSVVLFFIAATTRTGFEIGQNQMSSLGGEEELTVAAETISVFAQDHTITLAAPANLATINGFETFEGYVMILRLAAGSSNVTVVDTDNINLDGAVDFIMDTAGESQIWLVSDGAGNWNELSRALGS